MYTYVFHASSSSDQKEYLKSRTVVSVPRLANEIVKRGQDTQPYTQLLKEVEKTMHHHTKTRTFLYSKVKARREEENEKIIAKKFAY